MKNKYYNFFIEAAQLGLEGDKGKLVDLIEGVATDEVKKGRHKNYNEILNILDNFQSGYNSYSLSSLQGSTESVVWRDNLKSIWFPNNIGFKIEKLLRYYKNFHHLTPEQKNKLNKIIFYGPPGTGKTTIGFYLAQELQTKMSYVKITDVMSSRLGETMKNIARIFEENQDGIIFIDEFDALAKTRSDSNDVGELKRIVNSIIQTLDFHSNNRIIIVATNRVDSIDPAILRRFSFRISIDLLSKDDQMAFLQHLIHVNNGIDVDIKNSEFSFLTDVLSLLKVNTQDQISSLYEKTKAEIVLDGRKSIRLNDFLEVIMFDDYLTNLKVLKKSNSKTLSQLLRRIEDIGYSKTHLSKTLGVHRNTLPKYSKK